jgi:sodium--glutamate symport carrier gltS
VEFELRAQDTVLVYYFTRIGINASARDLLAGGRPLDLGFHSVDCLLDPAYLQSVRGISCCRIA